MSGVVPVVNRADLACYPDYGLHGWRWRAERCQCGASTTPPEGWSGGPKLVQPKTRKAHCPTCACE